jgi:hypothetical protein
MERGRPRNLESPEQMLELFEAYKDHIKSNPFLIHDYVGKDGKSVYREKEKPLTLEGFENYCYKRVGCVEQYFKNRDELYTEYVPICRAIKKEIREDQIQGGMAGLYNPSITQRLNGLVEKVDNTVNITQPLFPDNNE